MESDLPPKPKRVPFRKIRDHLAQIYKWQRRNRPIYGGLLEQRPNGFAVRRPESSGGSYTPPFSPVITADSTSPTLGITKGRVYVPTTSGGSPKVEGAKYALFPYMPLFQSTALDATIAPTLTLGLSSTNYVYLKITLTQYEAYIGTDTGVGGGTTGADVAVGTGGTDSHTHEAVSQHENVCYEYDGTLPEFTVDVNPSPAEFPACTLTAIYIPWGIVVIDGGGNSTTDTVWYRTGDFDFFPNNYTRSSIDGANPSPWTT